MAKVEMTIAGGGPLGGERQFRYGTFFSADVDLDANETDGTDSDILDVRNAQTIYYQAYGTGAASYSGNVTFTLLVSIDGTNWGTTAFATVVLAGAAGAKAISDGTDSDDVSGIGFLKVTSIVNGDASHAIADCNLIAGVYE